jgi:hypothetical protein
VRDDLANVIAWACVCTALWLLLLMFARKPPGFYAIESPVERVDRIMRYLVYAAIIWAVMNGQR